MDPVRQTVAIAVLAAAIAEKLTDKQLKMLAVTLTQLSCNLDSIILKREIKDNSDDQTDFFPEVGIL